MQKLEAELKANGGVGGGGMFGGGGVVRKGQGVKYCGACVSLMAAFQSPWKPVFTAKRPCDAFVHKCFFFFLSLADLKKP